MAVTVRLLDDGLYHSLNIDGNRAAEFFSVSGLPPNEALGPQAIAEGLPERGVTVHQVTGARCVDVSLVKIVNSHAGVGGAADYECVARAIFNTRFVIFGPRQRTRTFQSSRPFRVPMLANLGTPTEPLWVDTSAVADADGRVQGNSTRAERTMMIEGTTTVPLNTVLDVDYDNVGKLYVFRSRAYMYRGSDTWDDQFGNLVVRSVFWHDAPVRALRANVYVNQQVALPALTSFGEYVVDLNAGTINPTRVFTPPDGHPDDLYAMGGTLPWL